MKHLQGKRILGVEGNWDHMFEKHGVTEAEVVFVFARGPLLPKRNKRKKSADYMIVGKSFTGRTLRICYSWDDEKSGWLWVHTAF